jgi:mono/diheme cytochrome c family protein
MKLRNASWWLFITASALVSGGTGATAQTNSQRTQKPPDSETQQTLIRSLDGVDLYRAYCASCHGENGKGDGPVAPALKATVADLTVIMKNNGGKFPVARVRRIINGEGMIASHGSREMPVWGPIFHQVEADVDRGPVRLENLVKYLESIQTVASAKVPSGAELYKQHCVACHGDDLKGNGPFPAPYRTPPDLTTLARRHGGKFPEGYVSDILRHGVVLPAHGPAEMPVWGTEFKAADRLNNAEVTARIASLTNYIESRQVR